MPCFAVTSKEGGCGVVRIGDGSGRWVFVLMTCGSAFGITY